MRDLREAARALLATPVPTLVIVVTLALAIGANTAIFSVVNGVLLRPLGYAAEDELVVLFETNRQQGIDASQTSTGNYRDWRRQARSLDGQLAIYRYLGFTMSGLDRPARVNSLRVAPRLFDVLGVPPALGRTLADADEVPGNEHLVVLTHASWASRFGADQAVVGSRVELDGEDYTIVGVMPDGFVFPPGDSSVEMYTPHTIGEAEPMDRPHRMYDVVGRLSGGTSIEAARQELDAIAAQIAADFPDSNDGWGIAVAPIRRQVMGEIGDTLWVLLAAVFAVLLIACANIANLLVVRSTEASLDFMIRAALGAGRWQLVRRSLADSVLLGLLGGGGGLLAAVWGVSFLRSVMPSSVPRGDSVGIDLVVLAFAMAVTIAASLAFGLIPALRVMTPNLADALKGGGRSVLASRSRWLSNSMVVAEVALALVLLVLAGLMTRSFSRLSAVDPGFRREGVVSVTVQLPQSRYGFGAGRGLFVDLVDRAARLPGVTAVGAVSDLPMSEVGTEFEMPFTVIGLDAVSPTERPRADFRAVIPDYHRAMGIPLIAGRLFDRLDGDEGREVAIVNEALVDRYFPTQDPIGEVLQMPMAGELQIVGVVGNTRHGGLQSEVTPELYVPYEQLALNDMHVVLHSDLATGALAGAVGDLVLDLDPELVPTDVSSIEAALWESVALPRFNTALLVSLAVCAALLAAVGIYGVVSYSVVQRTREIGIRMALGADARETVGLVIRQAIVMVGVGAVIGIGASLGTTRFVAGMLFGVEPTDPVTYAVVTLLALGVGGLASAVPALRATRVDPVVALRRD